MSDRYLVVGSRPWSRRVFDEIIRHYPGVWSYLDRPCDLTVDQVRALKPRFVFILHWSSKVPADLVNAFECVGFHMTNLPYGRGGSPLQNLILGGARSTKLTAFRLTDEIDAGPVYFKEELSLDGTAEEIYERASQRAASMIHRLITEPISPQPQFGQPVMFSRRTVAESRLPTTGTLDQAYDFIRMLDAEGYPSAFLDYGGFRIEFRQAARKDDEVVATVRIRRAAHVPG